MQAGFVTYSLPLSDDNEAGLTLPWSGHNSVVLQMAPSFVTDGQRPLQTFTYALMPEGVVRRIHACPPTTQAQMEVLLEYLAGCVCLLQDDGPLDGTGADTTHSQPVNEWSAWPVTLSLLQDSRVQVKVGSSQPAAWPAAQTHLVLFPEIWSQSLAERLGFAQPLSVPVGKSATAAYDVDYAQSMHSELLVQASADNGDLGHLYAPQSGGIVQGPFLWSTPSYDGKVTPIPSQTIPQEAGSSGTKLQFRLRPVAPLESPSLPPALQNAWRVPRSWVNFDVRPSEKEQGSRFLLLGSSMREEGEDAATISFDLSTSGFPKVSWVRMVEMDPAWRSEERPLPVWDGTDTQLRYLVSYVPQQNFTTLAKVLSNPFRHSDFASQEELLASTHLQYEFGRSFVYIRGGFFVSTDTGGETLLGEERVFLSSRWWNADDHRLGYTEEEIRSYLLNVEDQGQAQGDVSPGHYFLVHGEGEGTVRFQTRYDAADVITNQDGVRVGGKQHTEPSGSLVLRLAINGQQAFYSRSVLPTGELTDSYFARASSDASDRRVQFEGTGAPVAKVGQGTIKTLRLSLHRVGSDGSLLPVEGGEVKQWAALLQAKLSEQ